MALRLARHQQRVSPNPSLIRFLSNSSSDSPPQVVNASVEKPSQSSSSPSDSSYSSPFADLKSTLKQKLQNQQEQGKNPFSRSDDQAHNRGSNSSSDNQSRVSLQDLGNNLAKFQRRSTVPPSRESGGVLPSSQSPPQISLEALYKKNAAPNAADPRNRKAQAFNSNNVWENLKNLRTQSNTSNNMGKKDGYLRSFKSTGSEALPLSLFGKEMGREGETEEMLTEFLTFYNEEELGEKLRMLRPEGNKEFSLEELNQRLVKLWQMEEKEAQTRTREFASLRNAISLIKNDAVKNEVISQHNSAIMGHLGGIPEYKHHPPKQELVDTYFHPDNMSSAEKMKIELTKVREEFKMSESDCGSARVQVAQLTTKIKHLSSSLHKKDKHSRKGLLGMVQKRKKLLKYLRRTDWDSYCLVLSKLSLRDNPDYKF